MYPLKAGIKNGVAGLALAIPEGAKIGKVEKIVREPASDRLIAVASVGGFLGIGAKEVSVPLEDMSPVDKERLVALQFASAEVLKRQPAYVAALYREIPADTALGEGVAHKETQADTAFRALDENGDGKLSEQEAKASPTLTY
jgi:hypothetical protein